MRSQPFHRRILPWIFVIVFVGVAPALVFYTAGYRWNPKKGMIERNGTVIIDSVPSGAEISIDGRSVSEKTPVTIQNMPPGTHRFEVSLPGYFPWSKSFDVIPEHVTFANDIRLWKRVSPERLLDLPPGTLSASPDERDLLYISSSSPTRVLAIDTRSAQQTELGAVALDAGNVFWSPNGRTALVESRGRAPAWLIDITARQKPLQLPAGRYRWEDSEIVGNDGKALLSIRLSDFSLSRTLLSANRVDMLQDDMIVTSTGTQGIAFVDTRSPSEGLLLPFEDWNFWSINSDAVVLRNGTDWLSLVRTSDATEYHTVRGDVLRQDPSTKRPRALLIDQTELWIWDPVKDPDLLLRQSDRMMGAAWHPKGKDIFYATEHEVRALDLDPRDGRLETTLASFDRIVDLAAVGAYLYVMGTKDGQTGVWSLAVE